MFAVRSSGHHSNAGFNSVNNSGVVIDVRNIKSLSVGDNDVVRVGAGCTSGEIYDFAEKNNLSVMGVVLADGRIINANPQENADLYLVLKGGGPNYGIVTRFDLQAYPTISTQYTVNLHNPSDYANILEATVKVQEAMEKDPKISLFVSFQSGFVAVGLLYADSPAERPKAFDPFFNLKSLINTAVPTTNGTIKSLVTSIAYLGPSARRTQSTATTRPSHELYVKVHEHFSEVDKTTPAELFYTIQPLSSNAVREGVKRGGNILGLEEVSQTWWAVSGVWTAVEAVDNFRCGIERIARNRGKLLDFVFMNDGSPTQTVLDTYGAGNVKKMRDASTKYDPEGIFQKLQNNGVLLRKI
ncbi:6-hydroxy-D-nicotine oxidase [Hypoxylon cercidicola]|nr:6-hydroxy-D-nicotine oxidase [Hypoxylon cercidicola]